MLKATAKPWVSAVAIFNFGCMYWTSIKHTTVYSMVFGGIQWCSIEFDGIRGDAQC